jgi:hypothetical protein
MVIKEKTSEGSHRTDRNEGKRNYVHDTTDVPRDLTLSRQLYSTKFSLTASSIKRSRQVHTNIYGILGTQTHKTLMMIRKVAISKTLLSFSYVRRLYSY